MVALELLVVLTVLLTSDGAKSKGKQLKNACDINAKFCLQVTWADYYNEQAIGELEDQTVDRDSFKGDLKRLLANSRPIKKLRELEVESKSQLVEASRTPLYMESHALFHLRLTCNDGRRPLIVCNETLDDVYLATYYLILAIEEVAEGKQLEAIKKAHAEFRPKFLKPAENKTIFEAVNVFESEVSRILETEQQN